MATEAPTGARSAYAAQSRWDEANRAACGGWRQADVRQWLPIWQPSMWMVSRRSRSCRTKCRASGAAFACCMCRGWRHACSAVSFWWKSNCPTLWDQSGQVTTIKRLVLNILFKQGYRMYCYLFYVVHVDFEQKMHLSLVGEALEWEFDSVVVVVVILLLCVIVVASWRWRRWWCYLFQHQIVVVLHVRSDRQKREGPKMSQKRKRQDKLARKEWNMWWLQIADWSRSWLSRSLDGLFGDCDRYCWCCWCCCRHRQCRHRRTTCHCLCAA